MITLVTQLVGGAEPLKGNIINIWRSGSYTLRQECFMSLISSVQKEVVSKDQTQMLFTWQANISELQDDGFQKMELRATRIMLRFSEKGKDVAFFDSSNKSINTQFVEEVFEHFIGTPIMVTFKNGTVIDVSVASDLWNDMPEPTSDDDAFFLERFKNLPSKENFVFIFDPFSWVSNPKQVGVKEEWKNKIQLILPVVNESSFVWNCKLNSIKKVGTLTLAEVVATGNLDVILTETASASVKAELKANFDSSVGMPNEIEAKTTVSAVKNLKKSECPETKVVALQRNSLRVLPLTKK